MSINLSARKCQILIGGVDFSPGLIEVSNWSTTPIDSSGLVKTSATVTIAYVRNLPEDIDDRKNPSRFSVGQTIQIKVSNDAGTLQDHPVGRLRLLSSQYDYETQKLTLNCGCLITLLAYRQPTAHSAAQITLGAATDRKTIVINLLHQAGITNIYAPYGLPHPISAPIRNSGSYLQTVGALLYSVGFLGFINKNEFFHIKPVQLTGNAVFTMQIGGDNGQELYYKTLVSPEAPREDIRVSGVVPIVAPPTYPLTSTLVPASSAPRDSDLVVVIVAGRPLAS